MKHEKNSPAQTEDSMPGSGSRMGAGSILRDGVTVGKNCQIEEYVLVQGPVDISDEVTIESFCYIRGPANIGSHVRLGPHSCLYGGTDASISVRTGAVVGANATLVGPSIIGEGAEIEPGAVVTKNVPANAVVSGNPAKICRYRQAVTDQILLSSPDAGGHRMSETRVPGVKIYRLPVIEDFRGNLSFGEVGRHIPFDIKRYFVTFEVASEEARGEHAHRTLRQFLICIHGRVHIVADDGRNREEFVLTQPNVGVYLPPMVWGVQYRFSEGAALLVLCSDVYDPDDYIRDYATFLTAVEAGVKA
jgi:UDP-2-acetamido-3-amino-2,3-dideoxy-glucuronate N-acetyltransferase